MPNARLEIIIVKYNLKDYEDETTSQVLNTVSIPYHLTVYENYKRDANLSTVWNDLIHRSDAKYIILLNNDTVPSKGWAKKLLEPFKDKKVGAVGAISNKAGGYQGGHKKALKKGMIQETSMLSGFCLAFPKKVWKEVGGFDEEYRLYGEDGDFCNKIKQKGYKLLIRFDTFIYHHKAKSQAVAESRGKDIEKIKRESQALFRKKWGGSSL